MKAYFIMGLMVLLSVAVGCSRKTSSAVTTKVTDSSYVMEIPRLVDVKMPRVEINVRRSVECDSNTNKPVPLMIIEKNDQAYVNAEITDQGELIIDSGCDSLTHEIEVRDKEIHRLRQRDTKETVVVTEYKTRQIDIVCRWFSGGVALAAIGFFGLKYLRTQIPLT